MLTKTGAKLLDFGLAKIKDATEAASANATSLPTITQGLTQEGVIVGTLRYMSPEQLEGKEADFRSDIFAFGEVLYEMASGCKAFTGRSQATLISSIMTTDPPPLRVAAPGEMGLPTAVDHVIRRCLAKDPADRWQSVHDLLLELKWASQARLPVAPVVAAPRRGLFIALFTMLAVAAAAEGMALFLRAVPEPTDPVRFTIPLPRSTGISSSGGASDTMAVSPDGRGFVFTATSGGHRMLYYRLMDSLAIQPMAGTERALFPFWSADSRFVAFFADRKLMKIDIKGGPPQEICDLEARGLASGSWGRDGSILVGFPTGPLHRLPATGGQPQQMLDLDETRKERFQRWPQFLPDGRHFAYLSVSADSGKTGIRLGELGSKKTQALVNGTKRPGFVEPGWLFFERQQSVLAQSFDFRKLSLAGDATSVADLFAGSVWIPRFSISSNGTLVYLNSAAARESRVTLYSRDGTRLGAVGEPGVYLNMTLSPEGKWVALNRGGPVYNDIWIMELASGIQSRLAYGLYSAGDPTWSPDGRYIAYLANEQGKASIRRKPIGGGPEEIIHQSNVAAIPQDWLADGSLICLNTVGIFYRLPPGQNNLQTLIDSPFDKDEPHVSPDGRWIAYGGAESGRWEVFVAAFPSFTGQRQVSSSGGAQPLWRKDGKELYYLTLDGAMTAVSVKTEAAGIETGPARTLFQTRLRVAPQYDQYRVTGNGQKFLILDPTQESAEEFGVVLSATAGLRR
jgi:Tol biopolymer transport system component